MLLQAEPVLVRTTVIVVPEIVNDADAANDPLEPENVAVAKASGARKSMTAATTRIPTQRFI